MVLTFGAFRLAFATFSVSGVLRPEGLDFVEWEVGVGLAWDSGTDNGLFNAAATSAAPLVGRINVQNWHKCVPIG